MSKPAAKTPPNSIEIPTTSLVLTRTPQSLNIDVDDDEENRKNERLTCACVIVTFHDGASSSPACSSSSVSDTVLAGWRWYRCPLGLLPAATALAAAKKGASFGDLDASLCVAIHSLSSLVDALVAVDSIFFALSHSSYRIYSREGAAASTASPLDAPHSNATEAHESPSPSRSTARGGTKDKITSAVAFDFVSGIMKGVVGGELYGE